MEDDEFFWVRLDERTLVLESDASPEGYIVAEQGAQARVRIIDDDFREGKRKKVL